MKLIFFIILTSISLQANALMYSAGSYVPYFNQVQTSDSGATQRFAINPYFGVGSQIHLAGSNYFLPELGYSYFLNTGSNYNKDTIFFNYNFAYVITNKFLARYGISNHWYRIIGNGGTQRLSNGDSSVSFPSPNKTVTSHFTTLNVGTEYFFSTKKYSLRFDFEIMNSRNFDERGYNYLLTVNIY